MIVGHQKIISLLDKSLRKGNLSHAYIFSGPEHVGKYTTALDFAKNIIGDIAETNPDLIIIKPEIEEKKGITKKKVISIETIREIQRKASISPLGGKYKIIIIDDADYLNISSQNALLKTLEEPPKNVILIMVTSNQEKFLPTIISRCDVKKFNSVSASEMTMALDMGENKEDILFWSLGRPGLAIDYINDEKELDMAKSNLEDFKKIISSNIAERFALAETWSKDTVSLIKKMSLWMVLVRHSLADQNNFLPLSSEKSLAILDKIGSALEALKNTNSNAKLVLEDVMLEM